MDGGLDESGVSGNDDDDIFKAHGNPNINRDAPAAALTPLLPIW